MEKKEDGEGNENRAGTTGPERGTPTREHPTETPIFGPSRTHTIPPAHTQSLSH